MQRNSFLLLLPLSLSLFVNACGDSAATTGADASTSGADASTGAQPDFSKRVGAFSVSIKEIATTQGTTLTPGADAVFFATTEEGQWKDIPTEGCIFNPLIRSQEMQTIEIGGDVYVQGEGPMLPLLPTVVSELTYYVAEGLDTADIPPNSSFSFGWQGSATLPSGTGTSLNTPPAVNGTLPAPDQMVAEELAFAWQAGDSSSTVTISVASRYSDDVIFCYAQDDGAFTIDAAMMNNMAGEAQARAGISRSAQTVHTLDDGRWLSLTGNSIYYTTVNVL